MKNIYLWKVSLIAIAVIALSSFLASIGKIQQALFPWINAGIYNAKTNVIGD